LFIFVSKFLQKFERKGKERKKKKKKEFHPLLSAIIVELIERGIEVVGIFLSLLFLKKKKS